MTARELLLDFGSLSALAFDSQLAGAPTVILRSPKDSNSPAPGGPIKIILTLSAGAGAAWP